MQLIYPGSHNLIFLFNSMIVLLVGVVGLFFFLHSIRRVKNSGWNFLSSLLLLVSGLMISFSLLNVVNYQSILNQKEQDNIGKYINSDNGYFIKLNQDMTWSSSREIFKCNKGEWEYIIDEDGEWVNLSGDCDQYFKYQFMPTRDNKTIEIFPKNGMLLNDVKQVFNKQAIKHNNK